MGCRGILKECRGAGLGLLHKPESFVESSDRDRYGHITNFGARHEPVAMVDAHDRLAQMNWISKDSANREPH